MGAEDDDAQLAVGGRLGRGRLGEDNLRLLFVQRAEQESQRAGGEQGEC